MAQTWQSRRGVPPQKAMPPPDNDIEYQLHVNSPSIAASRNVDATIEANGPYYRPRTNLQALGGSVLHQQYATGIQANPSGGRPVLGKQNPDGTMTNDNATIWELSFLLLASSIVTAAAANERLEDQARDVESSRSPAGQHFQNSDRRSGCVDSGQPNGTIPIDPILLQIDAKMTAQAHQRAIRRQHHLQPSNAQIGTSFTQYDVQSTRRGPEPMVSSGIDRRGTWQLQEGQSSNYNAHYDSRRQPCLSQLNDAFAAPDQRGLTDNQDLRGSRSTFPQPSRSTFAARQVPPSGCIEDIRHSTSFYGPFGLPPSFIAHGDALTTSNSNQPSLRSPYGQAMQVRTLQGTSNKRSFPTFPADDIVPTTESDQQHGSKRIRRSAGNSFEEDDDEEVPRSRTGLTIPSSSRSQSQMLGGSILGSSVSDYQQWEEILPPVRALPITRDSTSASACLEQTTLSAAAPGSQLPLSNGWEEVTIWPTGDTFPPEVKAVLSQPGRACRDP